MTAENKDKEHNLSKALDFVWPALTLSQQRLNEANRRLEAIGAISLVTVPTMLALLPRFCTDFWFILPLGLAFLAAIMSAVTCIASRSVGKISLTGLIPVADLAHKPKNCFADSVVREAGGQVRANRTLIRGRWRAARGASALLVLEFACFIAATIVAKAGVC